MTATVLVADRSASIRAVLGRLLDGIPGITVVGDAADGRETVRLAVEKTPAAIVLDLDLPSLGGRELVEAITARTRTPIFALTPRGLQQSARVAISLHKLGVVEVFPKPDVPDEWSSLAEILGEAIRHLGSHKAEAENTFQEPDDTPVVSRDLRYVAVGASTGGPAALFELLRALGRRPKVGVAVVQHIADGFEATLAEWLASELGMDVAVARHGERLGSGGVRIACPGRHLEIDRSGRLRLDRLAPPVGGHRPAAEVLFRSLLVQPAGRAAAVLLSGMGTDGAEAMAELRRSNVLTIAQDKRSSAVFGMPRAAIERRAAAVTLAPPQIGRMLSRVGDDR